MSSLMTGVRPAPVSQLKATLRAGSQVCKVPVPVPVSPAISSDHSEGSHHCMSNCESPSSSGQHRSVESKPSASAAPSDESEKAHAAKIKALYRQMAEAALGRLLAKTPAELKYYTRYCEGFVSALLELQDRETVTRVSRTIVSRMQIRLATAKATSAAGSARRAGTSTQRPSAPPAANQC